MPESYLWLIPLLPFTGFLINGTVGRKLPRAAVTGVALLFTAIPAALVAWLWATMKAAGAPETMRAIAGPFHHCSVLARARFGSIQLIRFFRLTN